MNIQQELEKNKDLDYQVFLQNLIPNTQVLGVRTPILQKIANRLDSIGFLSSQIPNTYEYNLLYGMCIAKANLPYQEKLKHLEQFMDRIDNWSVNDLIACRQKWLQENPEATKKWIQKQIQTHQPWKQRFAYTLILNFFLTQENLNWIFQQTDFPFEKTYYTQMAVAWLLSLCLLHFPTETEMYLKQSQLDTFTYNKTFQKAIESKQVSQEKKQIYRNLKQK